MPMEKIELPDELKQKLRHFERKLHALETLVAVSGAGTGLLLSWCVLYISDRLWATPWPIRLMLTLIGIACGAVFAFSWIHRWVLRRRDWSGLARLIQAEHPRLGDRLQGIVELSETAQTQEISPALIRAAIRQVSRESAAVDFEKAIKKQRGWTFGLVFLGALLILVPLFWFNAAAAMNAVHRWLNPIGNIARYTFVNLEALPDTMIVAHDEPFTLTLGIRADSFKKPGTAVARLPGRQDIAAEFEGLQATFQVPGLTQNTSLKLRIWDVTRSVEIEPVHRPAIRELHAFVVYPDYLMKSPVSEEISGGHVSVLKGSSLQLRAHIGRHLSRAEMRHQETEHTLACDLTDQGFLTRNLTLTDPATLILNWQDVHKLTPRNPYKLQVDIHEDQVPRVFFPEQPRLEAILVDQAREIELVAEDDHGLRQLGVEWFVSDAKGKRLSRTNSYQITAGDVNQSKLSGRFIFSAELMGIPAQTIVTLLGTTTDYYPDRDIVRSIPHRLYILSRSEHAGEIKTRFEGLQGRLEELSRAQENLETEALELQNLDPEKLAAPKATERIKELQRQQAALQRDLERLAREGMKLLEEAMRNKDIPAEQLQQWAAMLQAMQAIAGDQMQQAQQELNQAGQPSESRKDELKKAAEKMAEAVEKLQDMLKDLNDSLEKMAARNFVNRLRELAGQEAAIKNKLQELLPLIIGADVTTLNRSLRRRLDQAIDDNREVQREAQTVKDDLSSFFNRTRIQKYHDVYQEMREVELLDRLDEQRRLIEGNKTVAAMQAAERWRQSFEKWAKMLEDANNQQQDPGQDPSAQQMTAEQMLLLLKLMRVVQEEEEIRRHTRLLERRRDFDSDYAAKSNTQADQQQATRRTLNEIIPQVPPQAQENLKLAGRAMDDAERLLRVPQTDGQTIAAETEVIERLTAGLNQAAQCMGPGAMSGMMQMLMQQMGMGGGMMGGGSMAGGGGTPDDHNLSGPSSRDEQDQRSTKKFAGRSLENVAPEFRDVLKDYFNEVEKLER